MASNLWPIEMRFDLDDCLCLAQDTTLRVSAAAASAAALPTVELTPEDDVCSVCMGGFGSGHTNKRVPCGHVYHQSCIAQWSLHQNSCPLCRSKIFFSQT